MNATPKIMIHPNVTSRQKRAAIVILGTIATACVMTSFTDVERGIGIGFFSLIVLTLMTIPDDLQPGEYDVFGFGVIALIVVVGLVGMAMKPAGPRYYKGDDPPEAHAWPD